MTRQRKNTRDRKRRVAGEDADVLLPLLTRFAHSLVQNPDGTFSGHATYGKEEAPPFVRALMRVEAELLLDDARRLRTTGDACRLVPPREGVNEWGYRGEGEERAERTATWPRVTSASPRRSRRTCGKPGDRGRSY